MHVRMPASARDVHGLIVADEIAETMARRGECTMDGQGQHEAQSESGKMREDQVSKIKR